MVNLLHGANINILELGKRLMAITDVVDAIRSYMWEIWFIAIQIHHIGVAEVETIMNIIKATAIIKERISERRYPSKEAECPRRR